MLMTEKKWIERVFPRVNVDRIPVKVQLPSGEPPSKAVLINICIKGALVEGLALNRGQEVIITIEINGHETITKRGTVVWAKNNSKNQMGFKLNYEFHDDEMRSLLLDNQPRPDKEYDLAKVDYLEVSNQIRAISVCRSHIFMGTLAALGASAMTTGLILSRIIGGAPSQSYLRLALGSFQVAVPYYLLSVINIYYINCWLLFGSIVAGLLLTVGIMSTVEKARAINLRKAFLAALAEHLTKGKAPPLYRGWAMIQYAQTGCRLRRENEKCPYLNCYIKDYEEQKAGKRNTNADKEKKPSQDLRYPETCWTIGYQEASAYHNNKKKRIIPGTFDSFMSLSGIIYSVGYVLVSLILIYSLAVVLTENFNKDAVLFACAAACGLILGARLNYFEYKRFRKKGKKEALIKGNFSNEDAGDPEKVVRIVRRFFLFGGILLLLMTIILAKMIQWNTFSRLLVAGLSSLVLTQIALMLVKQLKEIRKGIYSLESLFFSWRRVLMNCHHYIPYRPRTDLEKDYLESQD